MNLARGPHQFESNRLRRALDSCPPGKSGWQQYETSALEALSYLFVPPLSCPHEQQRTYWGIDRRDAVFPNRITDTDNPWGLLRHDHDAKLIPVEFKNYDGAEIGKEETDQTRNYLKTSMGRLAIICSNKPPSESAYRRRNTIYTEEKKVILFLTNDKLKEMLDIKDRGDEPANLILDSVDYFLIRHE